MAALGRNRVAALACTAITLTLLAVTFGFEQMPESITRGMGAELFPRLVIGVILLLCALLALSGATDEQPLQPVPAMVYASGAALVAFMALLPLIGMLTAMLVFLLALGWLWGERRAGVLALSSFGLTAAIWAVFVKGFGIPLPGGMLGNLTRF